MACLRTPSTSSIAEGVRSGEPQLLEVPRRPLEPSRRRGRRSARSCRARRARAARARSSCGDADRVVARRRCGRGRRSGSPAHGWRSRPPTTSASATTSCLVVECRGRTPAHRAAGHRLLRRVPHDRGDLDRRVQRAQDGDRGRAERAGAADERPAARRRRVAGDGVQRHRERVGQHRDLVGDVVGHGERHRVVRRAAARRTRRSRRSSCRCGCRAPAGRR